jgi:hypothetical protein
MASGIAVGEAFVKIRPDVEGFESETKKTVSGVLAGIATGYAATKVVGFFKDSMDAASDFNESASKAEQIFGRNSGAIRKWASGAVSDFGQTSQQALENAASFGNMFQQLDIGAKPATRMSKTMVELASDFASFHNADITEVLIAQQAAFRGEYDAVQRFVPAINAAAVEQKALAMTGKESTKELTAGEKAAATYALMMQGAGKAVGDFDRTADGAANQQRQFNAGMKELQATIGSALLPILTQVLGVLRPVVQWLSEHRTVATALATVVGGVLVAAFVAWAVSLVQSTIATLGLTAATNAFTSAARKAIVAMGPWVALAALAAGTFVGLKHAITGGAMENNVYVASLQKANAEQLKQASALLLATAGFDGLKAKIREVAATSVATATEMANAADITKAQRQQLLAAIDKEAAAQERASRRSEQDAKAKSDQATQITGVKDAMLDLNNYLRAQVDDSFRLQQAQLSLDQSLASYTETLKGTTADTLEGRAATLDTEMAIRDYGQAVYDSQRLAGKETADATAAQIYSLGAVAGTLAPDSPLRAFIEDYIGRLQNGIPRDVHTSFNATDNVSPTIQHIRNQIATLPGNVQADFWSAVAFGGATRAGGGKVWPGLGPTLVGEDGPEIVQWGGTGTVIPNHALDKMTAPAAGMHVENLYVQSGREVATLDYWAATRGAGV